MAAISCDAIACACFDLKLPEATTSSSPGFPVGLQQIPIRLMMLRETPCESLSELQEEMRSMQRQDAIFSKLIEKFDLDGEYD